MKSNLPAVKNRHLNGTPTHLLRCPYYYEINLSFCNTLGHLACSSPACGMNAKSKEGRKEALIAIQNERIIAEIDSLLAEDKFNRIGTDNMIQDSLYFKT